MKMEASSLRLLYGRGSDLTNAKAVQHRAKCKLITQTTMLKLIDVANERGAKERVKSYWNTYYCQSQIYTVDGKMYAPQCKNRFCTYCCGVRKAELINKYLPVLQKWRDVHFITLTIKSVKAPQLPRMIKAMNRAFRLIKGKHAKRCERGTGLKLIGIKSLECNFNPKSKTYNPHFHLLVPSLEMAEILIDEWLNLWTKKYTHRDAQNCRKVEDTEKDLIEVIKYEAKVFTEPDGKRKPGKRGTAKIYVRALDNIYAALKGNRIIDRFGFNVPAKKKERTPCQLTADAVRWQYNLRSRDWLNEEHESTLTAYMPGHDLETILQNNMDTDVE